MTLATAGGEGLDGYRLLLGIAIGAEYAIGAAMLAEFAPSRGRGRRLSRPACGPMPRPR